MKSATIMVVEDSPLTLKMVRFTLDIEGYKVLEAPDGQTALNLASRKMPDLVLLDLRLPDMTGFDVCSQLRDLPGGNTVPILALTGVLGQIEESRLLIAGFTDIALKPVEPSRLTQIVESYLPRGNRADKSLGEGKNVLVADDDEVQLKLTAFHLKQAGCKVTTAVNGAEALEMAKHSPPDIILSDVLMPKLDGFRFCQAVRSDQKLALIPVVLSTSHFVEKEDLHLAESVGANAMIQRLPDMKDIVRTVLATLNVPAQAMQSKNPAHVSEEYQQRILFQLDRLSAMNATLAERSSMHASALSILGKLSETAARPEMVETTLGTVLTECLDSAGVSMGGLFLIEPDGQFHLKAKSGYSDQVVDELKTFFGHPDIRDQVISHMTPLALPSPAFSDEISRSFLLKALAKTALIAPLMIDGRCQGLLFMASNLKDLRAPLWLSFARVLSTHFAQGIALTSAVEQLSASGKKLQAVIEGAPTGMVMVNREGTILLVNSEIERLFGYGRAELLGRPLEMLMPLRFRKQHAGHQQNFFSTPAARAMGKGRELYGLRKNGSEFVVEIGLGPIETAEGPAVMASLVDVTERKQMERQAARLDELATLGQLMSGIAHELKNPLFVLSGRLQLASEKLAAREYDTLGTDFKKIEDAAQRMTTVTQRFLNFAMPHTAQKERCLINLSLQKTADFLSNELMKNHLRLVTSLSPNLPPIWCDPRDLQQVFTNLILNAVYAMAKANGRGTLTISTVPNGKAVEVRIQDDGPGIALEHHSKLFDPFFTTKPAGEGTGLGLWIVKSLITGMRGTIDCKTEVGRGTTFIIRLPGLPDEESS